MHERSEFNIQLNMSEIQNSFRKYDGERAVKEAQKHLIDNSGLLKETALRNHFKGTYSSEVHAAEQHLKAIKYILGDMFPTQRAISSYNYFVEEAIIRSRDVIYKKMSEKAGTNNVRETNRAAKQKLEEEKNDAVIEAEWILNEASEAQETAERVDQILRSKNKPIDP